MILDPSFHKNEDSAHLFSERDQVIVGACLAIHIGFDARCLSPVKSLSSILLCYEQTIWGQLFLPCICERQYFGKLG